MPPILGHIIVIAILAVPVYFAGRYCLHDIKSAFSGGGCGGCSGDCSSCRGSCSCGGGTGKTADRNGSAVADGSALSRKKKGPVKYAINGKIVIIPDMTEYDGNSSRK